MFKVGDKVVNKLNGKFGEITSISENFIYCKTNCHMGWFSENPIFIEFATPEEIAAGHRIEQVK